MNTAGKTGTASGINTATMSFGVDSQGDIESVFMLADALKEFWKDHAAEIENGDARVAVTMRLVPTDDPEWAGWSGFEEDL